MTFPAVADWGARYPNHIRHDCGEIKCSRLLADVPITYKRNEATFITPMPTPSPCKQLMISTVTEITERKYAEKGQVVEV
jgi:hypothetical protein